MFSYRTISYGRRYIEAMGAKMGRAVAVGCLLVVAGCSGELKNNDLSDGNRVGSIYPISQQQAVESIRLAIVAASPSSEVAPIGSPPKGYIVTVRFGMDTHTITAMAFPQSGTASDGARRVGYSFQVSHSGSMLLTGPARADSIFQKINEFAAATIAPIAVTNVSMLTDADVQGAAKSAGQAELAAWCSGRLSRSEIQSLSGKLPLVSASEITVKMLSLEQVPSAKDVVAIELLAEAQKECRAKELAMLQGGGSQQATVLETRNFQSELVLAELMKRRMSYGNANRLLKEVSLSASNALSAQEREALKLAQEREFENRRIAAQEAAASAQLQAADAARRSADAQRAAAMAPEPMKLPKSEVTNCQWIGTSLTCNTRSQ